MASWDGREPRAVVPTKEMMATENIIKASAAVARTSEYAFGLGISVFQRTKEGAKSKQSDDAELKPLPLYYVSPANVKNIPRNKDSNVKSGWYVAAEPGEMFELIVSPLRGKNSVLLTAGPGFDVILAQLEVDGKNADDADLMLSKNRIIDLNVRGFAEYSNEKGRSAIQIRRFKFHKHPTIPAGEPEVVGQNAGQIQLCFEKGTMMTRKRKIPAKLRHKKEAPILSMNEKTAIKKGLSISIPTDGEKEEDIETSKWWEIGNNEILSENITIFIRERFWLEYHGIIDSPIAPTAISDEVIEVHPSAANGNLEIRSPIKRENVFAPGEVITLD